MIEHTPGPRAAFVALDIVCVHLERDGPADFTEIVAWPGFDSCDIESHDEQVANANLIAAAPDLKAVALAYEQWEADVILDSKCWRYETPHITQALWDRFCEIQTMRNAALAKARGEVT